MRQAYDYWQDQPGNCRLFEGWAGCRTHTGTWRGRPAAGLRCLFIGRVLLHCVCGSLLPIVCAEQNASSHGFRTCSLPRAAPASGPVSLRMVARLDGVPPNAGFAAPTHFWTRVRTPVRVLALTARHAVGSFRGALCYRCDWFVVCV